MSGARANTPARFKRLIGENRIEVIAVLVVLVFAVDLLRSLLTGELPAARLLTFIWDGFVIGLSLGLAGIGLSMTYSILGFANVAHGDTMTTGVFFSWGLIFLAAGGTNVNIGERLLLGVGGDLFASELGLSLFNTPVLILVGIVVAGVLTALIALGLDRLVFRPLRDADSLMMLIASVGVAFALRYLVVFFYKPRQRSVAVQPQTFPIGGSADPLLQVDAHELLLVGTTILLMVGLHLLLQRTKLGKSMRAMADNEELARSRGIPTERVITWTWLLGGGTTGVAGFLIILERGTMSFQFGWLLLLLIFAAVILGGIGSIYGAIVGGIVIGMMTTVSLVWLPEATLARPFAFLVMIGVLLVRPQGIFGGRIVG